MNSESGDWHHDEEDLARLEGTDVRRRYVSAPTENKRVIALEDRIERTIKFGEKCIEVSHFREQTAQSDAEYNEEGGYQRGVGDMLFTLRTEETHDE